jgi:hypothetical protein
VDSIGLAATSMSKVTQQKQDKVGVFFPCIDEVATFLLASDTT